MVDKPTYEELEQKVLELEKAELKRKISVEELLESGKVYKLLIQDIQAAVVVHDADTQIIASNSEAQSLLGLTEDQMMGKTAIDPDWAFLNADGGNLPLGEYPVNQVMLKRQPLKGFIAGIYQPKVDDIVWVIVNANPVFDHKGSVRLIVVTFIDITERRRFEEALRESEQKYRALFEASGDAVFIAKMIGQELLFEDFNNRALEMFGGTNEDLIGKTPIAISPPVQPDGVSSEKMAIEKIQAALQGETQFFEWQHCKLDGTPFDAEVVLNPLIIGDDVYMQGIVADISARKKAEEALQTSEEKYSNLFHFSNDAIFIHDLEGNTIDVNQKALDQFGYTRTEMLALKIPDLHPPEVLEKSKEAFEKITREGFVNFEINFKKNTGEAFSADVSSSMFEIGGKKVVQGIVRDITDRKRIEKEREKLVIELQEALKEIKTLRGILPICSFCKKIRDDNGYWEQVDVYIHKHSQADISHSVCPACAKEHYPDLEIHDD